MIKLINLIKQLLVENFLNLGLVLQVSGCSRNLSVTLSGLEVTFIIVRNLRPLDFNVLQLFGLRVGLKPEPGLSALSNVIRWRRFDIENVFEYRRSLVALQVVDLRSNLVKLSWISKVEVLLAGGLGIPDVSWVGIDEHILSLSLTQNAINFSHLIWILVLPIVWNVFLNFEIWLTFLIFVAYKLIIDRWWAWFDNIMVEIGRLVVIEWGVAVLGALRSHHWPIIMIMRRFSQELVMKWLLLLNFIELRMLLWILAGVGLVICNVLIAMRCYVIMGWVMALIVVVLLVIVPVGLVERVDDEIILLIFVLMHIFSRIFSGIVEIYINLNFITRWNN